MSNVFPCLNATFLCVSCSPLARLAQVSSYAHAAYVANVSRLLASASCHRNNSFFTFRLLNATDNATLSSNFLLLQVPRFAKDIASVTLQRKLCL